MTDLALQARLLGEAAAPEPTEPLFRDVDMAAFDSRPSTPTVWWWDDYMPAGHVTLLSGHGGAGKSTLALMLGASLASGGTFLGKAVKPARVLFYSGEDPADEVLHRLSRICTKLQINVQQVRDHLRVIDATEGDPVLFAERRVDGVRVGSVTPAYRALHAYVEQHSIDVLIADNASDVFEGDEINRASVRAFMRTLARLVRGRGGAALLLAHVDKTTSRAGTHA